MGFFSKAYKKPRLELKNYNQTIIYSYLLQVIIPYINYHIYMKDQNQLEAQLLKLKLIAPRPIDLSFTLGYLASTFPLQYAKQVRPIAIQLLMMVQDGLVSSENTLQVLAVLKHHVIGKNSNGLVNEMRSSIQIFMNELALNKTYMQNKYFKKQPEKEEIVAEQLGVQCPICSTGITSLQLCYLTCGHMFHKVCLNAHCTEKISNKIIPIPCPQQNCKTQLQLQDISQFLDFQLRNKYDEFDFHNYVEKHAEDMSWCPTPGCSVVYAFDAALTEYKCPTCLKNYCLSCKCQFHEHFTCDQYKKMANLCDQDKKFMFLVKGSKFKQCPNCKFWVQRSQGCDHMTCRCKYQFCYICGGKFNRCKCKGFNNQVEQPRLLEPPPVEAKLLEQQRQVRKARVADVFINRSQDNRPHPQIRPPIVPFQLNYESLFAQRKQKPKMSNQRPLRRDESQLLRREDQERRRYEIDFFKREQQLKKRQQQRQRKKEQFRIQREAQLQRKREPRSVIKQPDVEMTQEKGLNLMNQRKQMNKLCNLQQIRMKMDSQMEKIKKLHDQYKIENKGEKVKENIYQELFKDELVKRDAKENADFEQKPPALKVEMQPVQKQKLSPKKPPFLVKRKQEKMIKDQEKI